MKLRSEKYKSGEKALTRKEYDKLISCIDNLQDELLIKMAVSTGLRREDICQVRIANIDLENGIMTFYEAKKDKDRPIHLEPAIILLIKKYLKGQAKRDRLFTFAGRTAYNRLNHWCRIAGIPERPFHALRATCVKFSQDAGWTTEQVSKHTGDSIRVIQEHYSTPSEGEMKEIIRSKPII